MVPAPYLSRCCAAMTGGYVLRQLHLVSSDLASDLLPALVNCALGTTRDAYKWYVLFKHSRQLVSSSCLGVRPLREPCVATGMNRGSWTGPCGR